MQENSVRCLAAGGPSSVGRRLRQLARRLLLVALVGSGCSLPPPDPQVPPDVSGPPSGAFDSTAAPTPQPSSAAPVPAAASTALAPLTLEEAVRLALAHNRALANVRINVGKAGDKLASARSYRLPHVSVGATEAYLILPPEFRFDRGDLGSLPGIGPVPSQDVEIETDSQFFTFLHASATQPLSQLYRIQLNVESQELQERIARERVRLEGQRLVAEVKRTYYAILQAQGALAAAGQAIGFFAELDRVLAQAVAQEAVPVYERLDVAARLARARHEQGAARNGVAALKEKLNWLLGRELTTPVLLAGTESMPTVSDGSAIEAAVSRARDARPEVREARLASQAAKLQSRAKSAELYPDLSLAAGYLRQFNLAFVPEDFAFAGVTLSWDLFDGGRKRREAAEAQKTASQAQRAVLEAEEQVALEVRTRLRQLEEVLTQRDAARLAQEAAAERLRVVRGKLDVDLSLLKDVLAAQVEMEKANYKFLESTMTLLTAEADLDRAVGGEEPEAMEPTE